ncbi:MAG: discoidin domain-containing protein [Candidatus Latescibacteria bacterium]|nr:discoidin domain-containing protein [Candidatus Latescibacterota bacterium]
MQPREARENENIALRFTWEDGAPADFTVEGKPRIWDNSALIFSDLVLVDGDPSTSTGDRFKVEGANQTGRTIFLDLGEPFPLNRIVFYPRQTGADASGHAYKDDFLKGYEVLVGDGRSYTSAGQPVYKLLKADRRNRQSKVDVQFPPQSVRFIRLRSTSPQSFEVAEIEFYGLGFSARAEYASQVIDFGGDVNFGGLVWDFSRWKRVGEDLIAAQDAQVSLSVETRSGTDDTPEFYFTKGDTVEVSKKDYEKLTPDKRGSVKFDSGNWSLWSAPHTLSGERITSPSPRRYFQLRITLYGTTTEMARLSFLSFQYSTPPLAKEVLAEIALLSDPLPPGLLAAVIVGKHETFTYDVRTEFSPTTQQVGFNALRIAVPPQTTFHKLEMGNPLSPVREDSVVSNPGYLTIYFPSNRITPAQNRPIRVTFEALVLVYGTEFTGEVFDVQSREMPQPVKAGNANEDVKTDNLKVILFEGSIGKILSSFGISPTVITPNGDAVNDEAVISYTVSQVIDDVTVDVRIYNLSGTLVRTLSSERRGSGIYRATWDGLDDARRPVAPGIYACEITIETNADAFMEGRIVRIVY